MASSLQEDRDWSPSQYSLTVGCLEFWSIPVFFCPSRYMPDLQECLLKGIKTIKLQIQSPALLVYIYRVYIKQSHSEESLKLNKQFIPLVLISGHKSLDILNIMSTSCFWCLLLLACFSSSDASQPPQIPVIVGQSYNLIEGNPFSQTIDPGFNRLVFNEVYTQGKTTDDGKYAIPDDLKSRVLSECSYQTTPKTFRGSQSYQDALKNRTDLSLGYHGYLTAAAFSFSKDYQAAQTDTIVQNKTLTYATADCKAYELYMDLNNIKRVKVNFKDDVKKADKTGEWGNFIQNYGSHFVYEVVMGSRVTQQTTYTYEAVSKLNSLGIDLKLAARASFAQSFNDSSFDWRPYQLQIDYLYHYSALRKEIVVGGRPPKNGNVSEWASSAAADPQPIEYKLTDLSVLFSQINDTDFNVSKAAEGFKAGLEDYCKTRKCQVPTQDRPNPPSATVDVVTTKAFGIGGGTGFEYSKKSATLAATKINLRTTTFITNIQLELGDGVQKFLSPTYGGNGGVASSWQVPQNETIRAVNVSWNRQINSLSFITDKQTHSPVFGRFAGNHDLLEFPAGYHILGIYGRSGTEIDHLGFIIGKTVIPPPPSQEHEQGKEQPIRLSLTTS